jgi:toxin HigB-1
VIKSFANALASHVWARRLVKGVPADMANAAYRKLVQLHNARDLTDLRAPPGNRLEALRGDRAGQHSIRVNDKWRVCFRWSEGHAHDVEIVDYH